MKTCLKTSDFLATASTILPTSAALDGYEKHSFNNKIPFRVVCVKQEHRWRQSKDIYPNYANNSVFDLVWLPSDNLSAQGGIYVLLKS